MLVITGEHEVVIAWHCLKIGKFPGFGRSLNTWTKHEKAICRRSPNFTRCPNPQKIHPWRTLEMVFGELSMNIDCTGPSVSIDRSDPHQKIQGNCSRNDKWWAFLPYLCIKLHTWRRMEDTIVTVTTYPKKKAELRPPSWRQLPAEFEGNTPDSSPEFSNLPIPCRSSDQG